MMKSSLMNLWELPFLFSVTKKLYEGNQILRLHMPKQQTGKSSPYPNNYIYIIFFCYFALLYLILNMHRTQEGHLIYKLVSRIH